MAAFPTSLNNPLAADPRIGSSEKESIKLYKNTFEGNYLQVRRGSTRSRKMFTLSYPTLTLAEYNILRDHFRLHVGLTFEFTNPATSEVFTVTYASGDLDKDYKTSQVFDTKIVLESI